MMQKTITCPSCNGTKTVKNGFNRSGKKQRYKCKDCQKQFVEEGWKWFVPISTRAVVRGLLLERLSLRGICRACGVSLSWRMRYIANLYKNQPDHLELNIKKVKQSANDRVYIKMMKVEADEMWTFVRKKPNKQWLWLALHTDTRQIIAFHIGHRGGGSAQKLWQKIPEDIREVCLVYSDDWDAYKGTIPSGQHCYSKNKGDTNHVERFNNTLRQRVSRLVRKSLAFSKSFKNHCGAIKYFICNYNLSLRL